MPTRRRPRHAEHMGDTGAFGDMKLIGEMYKPDVVLIPIGNHFVMSPEAAAMVVRDMIKPRYPIPIHFGTIPQLRGTPAECRAALGSSAGMLLQLDPGQKADS
ncbi:MAG: MBL fold metallo-hydrolase [Burkholderiales bacterium]|nr:MBL fold metallo-hydrolase [Burkholderiales bacterium]